MASPMAPDLPQRGSASQPRARPWVSQGPRSPRSKGTPHPDAPRALAPSLSLRRSCRTHGLAAKLTPGRCPGLICRAPLGPPWMPMIWEGKAPQAIRPHPRVTSRPHRPRAGSLLKTGVEFQLPLFGWKIEGQLKILTHCIHFLFKVTDDSRPSGLPKKSSPAANAAGLI